MELVFFKAGVGATPWNTESNGDAFDLVVIDSAEVVGGDEEANDETRLRYETNRWCDLQGPIRFVHVSPHFNGTILILLLGDRSPRKVGGDGGTSQDSVV